MIYIKKFICNPFQVNSFLLYDETREAIVIDAAYYNEKERTLFRSYIIDNNLKIKGLYSTHGHVDHILGNPFVISEYSILSAMHMQDLFLVDEALGYASIFGLEIVNIARPNFFLNENDIIKFGASELKILHLPGHSPGSLAFYNTDQKIVFCGDVLFKGSIGRTDLPGGNFETLLHSIQKKLFLLDDQTIVYCGHNEETTIGEEKRTNPFLQ